MQFPRARFTWLFSRITGDVITTPKVPGRKVNKPTYPDFRLESFKNVLLERTFLMLTHESNFDRSTTELEKWLEATEFSCYV